MGRLPFGARAQFHRDPLLYFDLHFPISDGIMRLPNGSWCIADPGAAKVILGNGDGQYRDHSDFFHTARGVFGPRASQVEIGRQGRRLLRDHVTARAACLPELIHRRLAPASDWPDAGNLLVYEHLRAALVGEHRPASLRDAMDRVVALAVVATARQRQRPAARLALRYQALHELMLAVAASRARDHEPPDLLDVIARAAPDAREVDLAEVFLSFLFAIAGSIGFTLGWAVCLAGTSPDQAPPSLVVREALRLWPVAWMFERQPIRPHRIAGVTVTPRDRVAVCTYLVHRHPDYWRDPSTYDPHRWSQPDTGQAYLPFGYGPHSCPGAAMTVDLVAELLTIMARDYRPTVQLHRARPHIGPALAPPPFTLHLG